MKPSNRFILFLTTIPILIGSIDRSVQAERIVLFSSDCAISTEGILTVTETIHVESSQVQIRHGVFRDFKTVFRDAFGLKDPRSIQVLSASRNGKPENYWTEKFPKETRLYLGDRSRLIPIGKHEYQIHYKLENLVRSRNDIQEIEIELTGNHWAFPIEETQFHIQLPIQATGETTQIFGYLRPKWPFPKRLVYEGSPDGKGQSTLKWDRLSPGKGLEVRILTPSGTFAGESSEPPYEKLVANNGPFFIGIGGLSLLVLYYLTSWWMVGRDPKVNVVRPMKRPPNKISPAMVRHLLNFQYDPKSLQVAIFSMAAKGYIRIRPYGESIKILRAHEKKSVLSKDERVVADHLLGSKSEITATDRHYARFAKASEWLREYLEDETSRLYISENGGFAVIGWILSYFFMLPVLGSDLEGRPLFGSVIVLTILYGISYFALSKSATVWVKTRLWRDRKKGWTSLLHGLEAGFVLMMTVSLITLLGNRVGLWFGLLLMAVFLTHPIFRHLLRQPTPEGKRILMEIQSFRSFMEERISRMESTSSRREAPLESLFPYAVAFGFSNDWVEAFADKISKLESICGIDPMLVGLNTEHALRQWVTFSNLMSHNINAALSAETQPAQFGGSSLGMSGGTLRGGGGGSATGFRGSGGGGW